MEEDITQQVAPAASHNGHHPSSGDTDPQVFWNALPWETRLRFVLETNDPNDLVTDHGYAILAFFRYKPYIWGKIATRAQALFVKRQDLEAQVDDWINDHPEAALLLPRPTPHERTSRPTHTASLDEPWREHLVWSTRGELKQTAANLSLILAHHPYWQDRLWLDVIRGKPMCDTRPLADDVIMDMMCWLQMTEHLPTTMHRLVERCAIGECQKHPRDLLQIALLALPVWDGIARLETWLEDCAGVTRTLYSMAVSRLLLVSMVARVMQPGCLYRYVVILEGPEEYRKSTLVQALAEEEWYIALAIGLETKESHMMLQGAWVAELPELDSLSRTEETRLKAFFTMKEDMYIPKYSNFRLNTPRRTIFVGTTNEESYLKGQTGNTRFLPIKLGHEVDIPLFLAMREQLLAEAFAWYGAHTAEWWMLPEEALHEAKSIRESRRLPNIYEEPLRMWLEEGRFTMPVVPGDGYYPEQNRTTWQEIARYFLKLEKPADWKDLGLQRQIATALRAIGWTQQVEWDSKNQKAKRVWSTL